MKSWLSPVNNSGEKRLLWIIFSNCLAWSHHGTSAVIFVAIVASVHQKPIFHGTSSYEFKHSCFRVLHFASSSKFSQ